MLYRVCLLMFLVFQFSSQAQKKSITVTAYYAGDTAQINQYDPKKLTHIIFSFCHLKGNRLHVDDQDDSLRIQKLVGLKKTNPSLKVLLSLGGWGGCASCSDVFSSEAGRNEFALSVRELNDYFGTDGIDLDWEYPAVQGYPGHTFKPEDKSNFTALVVALRKSLGAKNEISFAAGGFQKFIDEAIDWESVMKIVDRVNLMSYDLVHGYSPKTGHHTALYSTSQQNESADNAIKALLKKGIPANKIVIGAAFYAREWEGVSESNNGLYQSGKFRRAVGFKDFSKQFGEQNGYQAFWDEEARAPYLYNKAKRLFVTYDDQASLAEKVKYVKANGLNGIMFWELSHDVTANGLLDAIHQAKVGNK
jgi:chitinase